MNRIFKFRISKKRKAAIQPIRGMPVACSFCGGDLLQSPLNAASRADNSDGTGPLAVICASCITRLEPLCRLMDWYQRFFRQENGLWTSLSGVIDCRLASETGSPAMKRIVADLLLRLLKRSFSIIAGFRANGFVECPRTGVSLSVPRIAIVTSADPPDSIVQLIVAGADAAGLPTYAATDVVLEDPIRALKTERCNNDSAILAIGLLVLDEYVVIPADIAVIYVLATAADLHGEIEVIQAPRLIG